MDVLANHSIFQELQLVHDTGYFSAMPSLEENWQQVSFSATFADGVRAYPTSLGFRVVRSKCGCQLYLFRPEVRVQFRGEMGTLVLSITHIRNLPEWMGWRRRVIKLSNAICKDEELDLIIGTEFSLE